MQTNPTPAVRLQKYLIKNEFRRQNQSVWSLVGAFLKLWGHAKHPNTQVSNMMPEENREI